MHLLIKQMGYFKPLITLLNLKLYLTALLMFLALTVSCGKRASPLPPIERVPQRVVINGVQRGNKVNLNWQMPARNAPDGSVLNVARIEVYRLAEGTDSPLTLNEEEFSSQSTVIASVPISDTDFARKNLTYTDTLEFAGQPVRLRYAIRFVNDSGQRAAFSNYLLIEPTAKVANAPSTVSIKITESSLIVNWETPQENVDGSKPVNILGYNIYRSIGEINNFSILNKSPLTETKFADGFFEFGQKYKYIVRTVSLGGNGEPVESLDSQTAEASPTDTYAPSAPEAITIAAAPNNISIFFAVNPEKDIAGYRVYRTENQNLSKPEWTLLTTTLIITNTFQDKTVETGKTYYYYLTAVDKTGNVSQPSEVVSETAP